MRQRLIYPSVLLALLCCSTPAHAAKNVEIVRYPTLLMLGGLSQSVGVSYSYAQHQTPNSTSSGSSLREGYSFGTVAAILDPHLVTLQLMGGLSYSQHFDDKTSTLLDGEYNIVASAFDMSYHPALISSSRTTTVISNGYTPTYSLTNNSNQVSLSLLNSTLPVQLYYVHSTSESSGLPVDATSVSDAAGLSLHHGYLDISDTRFSLSHSRSSSGTSSSSGYQVSLGNFLTLDEQHRYRLSSSLDVSETSSSGVPQRNISISEDLSCAFGAALNGSLSDRFSTSSTLDFDGNKQSMRNNSISASLSHRLYQSLTTSLSASVTNGSSMGGTTSSYGGAARVSYSKILPAQSNLSLALDGSRNISSQELADPQLSVRDEPHLAVNWGDRIEPALSGRLTQVISVRSLNVEPQIEYLEGIHYLVNLELGYIEILQSIEPGSIVPGSDIVVSYTVAANSSISFETIGLGSSANLTLFGGRYNLGASYSTQSQRLVSGETDNEPLVSSNSLNLVASANFNPTLMGMEYGLVDSTQEQTSHFAAYLSHSLRTASNAAVSFTLRDTYTMVGATEAGTAASNQNTFSASASYSRKFFRWVNFLAAVAANDSRSGGRHSDFLSLRGALNGSYNQLQLSLTAQTLYRIAGQGTTRDSNFSCSITRFF